MQRIQVTSFGPLQEADISFGDMTVFVGEQASGKSLMLQLVKLVLDAGDINHTLKTHGYGWGKGSLSFLSRYFGQGMERVWHCDTQVAVNGMAFSLDDVLSKKGPKKKESLFLIPAHRVLTLREGWPRAFMDYASGYPYVVRQFSEHLRRLMEAGLGTGKDAIFPQSGRMNRILRDGIEKSIFGDGQVRLDTSVDDLPRRIVLDVAEGPRLPLMAWSAGQREFLPLLLGLYWLMPSGRATKRKEVDWVVIEEPELGLHAQAISFLLLVFLELLRRGYRVIVSTHSPQFLEWLWAIRVIARERTGPEKRLLKLLDLPPVPFSKKLVETGLKKTFSTYYFSRQKRVVSVKDISTLDPGDVDADVSDWGGLTLFGTRVSEWLTAAIAEENS